MPITSISEAPKDSTSSVNLADLGAGEDGALPDEKITKDIFLRILTRFGKISAEGKPDKNNETLKVTQSIAPVLFNLLDLNKDGVLERREIDLLKCLLPHFSPAILNHSQKHQDRSLDAEPALSW